MIHCIVKDNILCLSWNETLYFHSNSFLWKIISLFEFYVIDVYIFLIIYSKRARHFQTSNGFLNPILSLWLSFSVQNVNRPTYLKKKLEIPLIDVFKKVNATINHHLIHRFITRISPAAIISEKNHLAFL